ncbi:MAG: hypothetical protein IJB98_03685 [Clostridia bacterium]|nr:hypothetical protein [Clostridia bacterium]
MKKEFWKHQIEILFCWPFFTILSISGIVIGILLTIRETYYWPILFFSLLIFLICIYAIFFQEKTLSKIIFTEQEIIVKRFSKILISIKWSEISEIKGSYYGRSARYMTFFSYKNKIDVVPTKKMYDAIISICPYDHLKSMINNIEQFKWFHKNHL